MTVHSKEFVPPKGIQVEVENAVFDLFKSKQDARYVFHNYEFAAKLQEYIKDIASDMSLSEQGLELLTLAAWFYPIGYILNYAAPTEASVEYAERLLLSKDYSKIKVEKIKDLIRLSESKLTPKSEEQEIFHDALNAVYFGSSFLEKTELLQLEKEFFQKLKLPKDQWGQLQLQELLNTRYYTPYSKLNFEPTLATNILTQRERIQKSKKKRNLPIEETNKIFQNIGDKVPDRAIQTFYRTNYRNHINLSAIADAKANIMISVNAILLSVLISLLTYNNIAESRPMVLVAVIIFSVTGLTSLVFAVLSARPKVTALNKNLKDIKAVQRNIVFFGNFVHLDLEEYEEAMDGVFRSGELLYGNMARDIYHLGKVLDKKYKYLISSYNIFMVGFVATVITLLIALIL